MSDEAIIAGIEKVKAVTTFNRAVKVLLTRTGGDPADFVSGIREATTYAVVSDLIEYPIKTRRVIGKLLK